MKQIEWKNEKLYILDQTLLPLAVNYIECTDYEQVCEAIKKLSVRGAPLIGVTASLAIVLASQQSIALDIDSMKKYLLNAAHDIRAARPTAVNLMWAVDRMIKIINADYVSKKTLKEAIRNEAFEIWEEDRQLCLMMGGHGLPLIPDEAVILTHCNTGSLAAAGDGTALSVIRHAHRSGKKIHVYVDETRPLLQGSRLTAWELTNDGIPFTLIADNMAAHVMRTKKVSLVITGADRIALNGDSANKIGTYGLSVLAKHHGIPFYITAPYSTIDLSIKSGNEITIEERSGDEVRSFGGIFCAPEKCRVYNPAFDVTPGELITAIITDKGIINPPYIQNIQAVIGGLHGR